MLTGYIGTRQRRLSIYILEHRRRRWINLLQTIFFFVPPRGNSVFTHFIRIISSFPMINISRKFQLFSELFCQMLAKTLSFFCWIEPFKAACSFGSAGEKFLTAMIRKIGLSVHSNIAFPELWAAGLSLTTVRLCPVACRSEQTPQQCVSAMIILSGGREPRLNSLSHRIHTVILSSQLSTVIQLFTFCSSPCWPFHKDSETSYSAAS